MDPTAVVRPLPGSGLAARVGELLLVCADTGPGAGDLLSVLEEVAALGGDGGILVRRVAALLASDFDGRYPACAAGGPASDGRLAVLVHGGATADVAGGDGMVSLSGADAVTSVNRLVNGPVTAVRLLLPGAGPGHPRARLDGGVVVAAGLVQAVAGDPLSMVDAAVGGPAANPRTVPPPRYTPSPFEPGAGYEPFEAYESSPRWEPAGAGSGADAIGDDPPPRPVSGLDWPEVAPAPIPQFAPLPALPSPVPFEVPAQRPAPVEPSVPFDQPAAEAAAPSGSPESGAGTVVGSAGIAPDVRQPDPVSPFVAVVLAGYEGGPAEPPVPVPDPRSRVLGVICGQGHFTDPDAPACTVCGRPADGAAMKQEGPRPPLGLLRLDDGSMFRLDADYVAGREPQQDPEVAEGTVRPLRVADAAGIVSRRHIRIMLVGWSVQVVDLGSANGTSVQYPGGTERIPLPPNQPVVLWPGSQIILGRRWLRFEPLRPV